MQRALPPVPVPSSSVTLEVVFVERPVNDPLLGSPLWNEMDQLAGIPAERRLSLSENGFRIGLCGTEPPPTLDALMAEVDDAAYDDDSGFLTGRRFVLRPGGCSEVQSSVEPRDWAVEVHRSGAVEAAELPKARGVFRIELIAVEDGYAELRLIPEIHHGSPRTKPTLADAGWRYETAQPVTMLSEASFLIRLSLGELFVLSADETAARRVGNQFFRREEDGRLMQRVLVLRVGSIGREGELAFR